MRLRRLALLAAALLALASPALAAPHKPKSAAPRADARIRTVDYDAQRIVRLAAPPRTAVQIAFGPGETVRHVALGDSASWEVAAEGGLVFVKPAVQGGASNMIVVTGLPAGGTRTYAFELSRSARKATPPTYILGFRYLKEDAARLAEALSAERQALERRILDLKLERGAVEGPRNFAYAAQGEAALQPSEVTDNGRFTVLRFPGTQAVPSLFLVGPDGQERPAAFDVRGEFVVIHETAPQITLRRGRARLCLFNLAWSPRAAKPATGTASGEVLRTDKAIQP